MWICSRCANIARFRTAGRLKYRLYRHPLIMFGLRPAYLFLLQQRLPVGLMRNGWQPWASTMATNLAIALIIAILVWLVGIKAFLLVHLPIMLLAGTAGMWLFTCNTSSSARCGRATVNGGCMTRLCVAVRITTCRIPALVHGQYRRPYACITCAAAFRIIVCRKCYANIRSCAESAD